MRRHARLGGAFSLCLFFLIAPSLLAESYYLRPGHPDGVALLPPPPVPGSEEEAADLASARAVFKGRTPAEAARAARDYSISIFLFAPAIGPFFQEGKLPKTEALFKRVKNDITEPLDTAKDHFHRRRPYQMDEQLSLGAPEKSFGYPSGHSTRSTVEALLLAEMFPDNQEAILTIGRNIGWDRVLIGKHFPTDIYAGRVLGRAIVRELLASLAFQHDLAEAKSEVEAARRAPADAVSRPAETIPPEGQDSRGVGHTNLVPLHLRLPPPHTGSIPVRYETNERVELPGQRARME
jgi:acid phosphatase (class A)